MLHSSCSVRILHLCSLPSPRFQQTFIATARHACRCTAADSGGQVLERIKPKELLAVDVHHWNAATFSEGRREIVDYVLVIGVVDSVVEKF